MFFNILLLFKNKGKHFFRFKENALTYLYYFTNKDKGIKC